MNKNNNTNGKYFYQCQGMSSIELDYYSQFEHNRPNNTVSETEYYGTGKILRNSCLYPSSWPIRLRIIHGPSQWDYLQDYFIEAKEPFSGLYSKRLKRDFDNRTSRKSFIIKSPFWVYYKNHESEINIKKKGTIFFLSHSTHWDTKVTEHDLVIEYLQNLPEYMQPVAICIYYLDVQNGVQFPYMEKNIPVFTVGTFNNNYFIHNFFEIIKNYKYCLSNSFGSQIFYCTMIGIPSMLINELAPSFHSLTNINDIKALERGEKFLQLTKVKELFSSTDLKITPEQLSIIEEELGIKDGVSMFTLSVLLYYSFFLWKITNLPSGLRRYTSKKIKTLLNITIKNHNMSRLILLIRKTR
jgi:hypothetical protein